jgi:hypothetical protein
MGGLPANVAARALRGGGVVRFAAVALWLLVAGAGMFAAIDSSTVPGAASEGPRRWPVDSAIRPVAGRANLVVVLHPQCTCSRATVAELGRLMTWESGRLAAHVLLVDPDGTSPAFSDTDLWAAVAQIPGVEIERDANGGEASRFGALTSGQTYLYSPDGERLFAGGITPARGHEGPSEGRQAILAALQGAPPQHAAAPVFGCSLFDPIRSRGPDPDALAPGSRSEAPS